MDTIKFILVVSIVLFTTAVLAIAFNLPRAKRLIASLAPSRRHSD